MGFSTAEWRDEAKHAWTQVDELRAEIKRLREHRRAGDYRTKCGEPGDTECTENPMTKTYNFVEMRRDPDSLPEFDREKIKQCSWCGEFHTGDATEMGMEHEICAIPCPLCTIDQLNSYIARNLG